MALNSVGPYQTPEHQGEHRGGDADADQQVDAGGSPAAHGSRSVAFLHARSGRILATIRRSYEDPGDGRRRLHRLAHGEAARRDRRRSHRARRPVHRPRRGGARRAVRPGRHRRRRGHREACCRKTASRPWCTSPASSLVGESVADPLKYYRRNVGGTRRAAAGHARRRRRRASCSPRPPRSTATRMRMPIDEAHPTQPVNPYGATKLAVERMLAGLQRRLRARRRRCCATSTPPAPTRRASSASATTPRPT